MAMLSFCGIDVSKDHLDVVVLPEGWFFSVSNETAGWAELVVRLRPLTVSAIGLEPSGGYERGIIRALLAAGLSVRRINPNKLRQFARARGVLAKNDRLDARLIAEYVAIMPTRVVQRDAAVERLAEIVNMRRQLCDEHVAAENQAAHLEDAMLKRLSKRRLPEPERTIGDRELGANRQPTPLQIEEQSRQDCALSRIPSVRPTSSLLPSGVAPMMISRHCAVSSRRACT
jgi:transposase